MPLYFFHFLTLNFTELISLSNRRLFAPKTPRANGGFFVPAAESPHPLAKRFSPPLNAPARQFRRHPLPSICPHNPRSPKGLFGIFQFRSPTAPAAPAWRYVAFLLLKALYLFH